MKKAYIILAHKNWEQVCRLVKSLDDPYSFFFIHYDKKAPAPKVDPFFLNNDKITMLKPIKVNWGELGTVRVTIDALDQIKLSAIHYDTICLLSGQDYPIQSNRYIHEFFLKNPDKNFIDYCRLPNFQRWQPNGGMYRIEKYFFGLKDYQRLLAKVFNFFLVFVPFVKRKFPIDLIPYGGSSWWCINQVALNYILAFIKNNPAYLLFHKYTFASDEVFFHTILLNSKDEKLNQSFVNNNLRYMNWPDTTKAHPEILSSQDLPELVNSEALFARKFDMEYDRNILDLLDQKIKERQ